VLAPTLAKLPIVVRSRQDEWPARPTSSQASSEALQEGFDSDEYDASDEHVAVTKAKNAFLEERKTLQQEAQKYGFFDLPLQHCNIAHAETMIRQQRGKSASSPIPSNTSSPQVTVDIIVSPQEDTTKCKDCDGTVACMELVRMVNSVPLLDGVESIACGLVRATKSSTVWSSFGLTVLGATESDEDTWINRFRIRDSDQVAPFFQQSNHNLWDGNEGNDLHHDDASQLEEKKRKRRSAKLMLPANVRLGKILVVVNVQAAPNMIPMPTLTKGRLPMNHEPITQAFHIGIRDCLRNLQVTNPGLLLTSAQLRSVERDVRYVPLVARASANLLNRLQNQSHQNRALTLLKKIQHEDEKIAQDPNLPLGYDNVVQMIENRSRMNVLAAEAAKKRSKRSRPTRKTSGYESDGYEDIEDSDKSVSPDTARESIQVKAAINKSLSEQSSAPVSNQLIQEIPKHDDFIVGGIEIHNYDDDDEWW
jgi:hypothetical protein